jgi:hypothetical protein
MARNPTETKHQAFSVDPFPFLSGVYGSNRSGGRVGRSSPETSPELLVQQDERRANVTPSRYGTRERLVRHKTKTLPAQDTQFTGTRHAVYRHKTRSLPAQDTQFFFENTSHVVDFVVFLEIKKRL